jgi:hypothetical protein
MKQGSKSLWSLQAWSIHAAIKKCWVNIPTLHSATGSFHFGIGVFFGLCWFEAQPVFFYPFPAILSEVILVEVQTGSFKNC